VQDFARNPAQTFAVRAGSLTARICAGFRGRSWSEGKKHAPGERRIATEESERPGVSSLDDGPHRLALELLPPLLALLDPAASRAVRPRNTAAIAALAFNFNVSFRR
jgi:hypothetical protein